MNAMEAKRLVRQVVSSITTAAEALTRLFDGQAWTALGYDSWADLCRNEFGALAEVSREQRQQIGTVLTEARMSTRAQATALGVHHSTIQADRQVAENPPPAEVIGLDGKTYVRPERPTPAMESEPDVALDVEFATEPEGCYTAAPIFEVRRLLKVAGEWVDTALRSPDEETLAEAEKFVRQIERKIEKARREVRVS